MSRLSWFFYLVPLFFSEITFKHHIWGGDFCEISKLFYLDNVCYLNQRHIFSHKNIFYKDFLHFIEDNYCHCKFSEVNELTLDVVKLLSIKYGSVRNKDLINSIWRPVLNICKQSKFYFLDSHFPKD